MVDAVTINQLPLVAYSGSHEIEIQVVGGGSSGKITLQSILDQVPPSDGAVWGQITGTLSNQLDLQSALDAKADVATTYTKAEVDALLAGKLNTSGGTLTGALRVEANIVSTGDVQAFQP